MNGSHMKQVEQEKRRSKNRVKYPRLDQYQYTLLIKDRKRTEKITESSLGGHVWK